MKEHLSSSTFWSRCLDRNQKTLRNPFHEIWIKWNARISPREPKTSCSQNRLSVPIKKTQTSKLIKTRFSGLLRLKHIDQTNVLTRKWLKRTKDKYPHELFSPLLNYCTHEKQKIQFGLQYSHLIVSYDDWSWRSPCPMPRGYSSMLCFILLLSICFSPQIEYEKNCRYWVSEQKSEAWLVDKQ